MKKTILLDLDGVLNTYTGEYDEKYIPPMKAGALEFIQELAKDYKVKIFTSRNLLLTAEWLIANNLREYIDEVTNVKCPSYLIIDDRCIRFDGDFQTLRKQINGFKVWYRKG